MTRPTPSGQVDDHYTPLLTCQAVAERAVLSVRTVQRAIASGAPAAVRPSPRTIRIREADLDAWLQPQQASEVKPDG